MIAILPLWILAVIEILALAPVSDLASPRIWAIHAAGTAVLCALLLLPTIVLRCTTGLFTRNRTPLRRSVLSSLALSLTFWVAGLGHLWPFAERLAGRASIGDKWAFVLLILTLLAADRALRLIARRILTEWYPRSNAWGLPYRRFGLYSGRYKWVLERQRDERLFDLERSPYEQIDQLDQTTEVADRLRRQLDDLLFSAQDEGSEFNPGEEAMDPALLERLQALGYL